MWTRTSGWAEDSSTLVSSYPTAARVWINEKERLSARWVITHDNDETRSTSRKWKLLKPKWNHIRAIKSWSSAAECNESQEKELWFLVRALGERRPSRWGVITFWSWPRSSQRRTVRVALKVVVDRKKNKRRAWKRAGGVEKVSKVYQQRTDGLRIEHSVNVAGNINSV